MVLLERREHFVECDGEFRDLVATHADRFNMRAEVARQRDRSGRVGDVGDRGEGPSGDKPTDAEGKCGQEQTTEYEHNRHRAEKVVGPSRRCRPDDVSGDALPGTGDRLHHEPETLAAGAHGVDVLDVGTRGSVAEGDWQRWGAGGGGVEDKLACWVEDLDAPAGRREQPE